MASMLWFRKGLRLHDNPALLDACKSNQMYPVFIIDPHFLKNGYRVGVNRYEFLLQSLRDLDSSLKARGSRLLVIRGKPEEVLPRVVKDWGITRICYEVDTEPYAKARDEAIRLMAEAANVQVSASISHTLYDTGEIVRRNGGKAPLTYQSFVKLIDRMGPPVAPVMDPPTPLPGIGSGAKGTEPESTGVPTYSEMGFPDEPSSIFKGGETEALKRMRESLSDISWVATFEKPQTDPSAFLKPATTVLSPYLKFGCLSARLFHSELLRVYAQAHKHSEPPVSLRGQLLWREFFYTVGSSTPNFHQMVGNPICRQIDWDDNEAHLAAWREGRTGFPWIDAIMTQLREWGWVHHLARHSVACFLTRGDLYISWEKGQEVFEELLIDQDHFLNAGNWMWLSASAFFSQYFRVYSPVVFGKKYDPEGKFIRRFLPILKDMPAKYIYEPWLAPLEVQKKAGCIIGKDYPKPIVDHAIASKACIARMGLAYKASKSDDGVGEGRGVDSASPKAASPKAASRSAGKASRGHGSKGAKAAASGQETTSCREGAWELKLEQQEDDSKLKPGGKRQKTLIESGFKKE